MWGGYSGLPVISALEGRGRDPKNKLTDYKDGTNERPCLSHDAVEQWRNIPAFNLGSLNRDLCVHLPLHVHTHTCKHACI